jgi:chromosome segregation ATPase
MLWCCSDNRCYLQCQIITGYVGSRTNSQRTGSFAKRFTDDKEENIQQIITRKKGICEEIHKIRKSLNDHLDQLQETLIRSINKTVDDVTLQLGDVKNSVREIENKTSDITLEFNKIKEHASDLQTFLS